MEENLRRQEETQEPREEVWHMHTRYSKLHKDAEQAIASIEANVKALDAAIKLRHTGYTCIVRITSKAVNK